jgi:hypothetical protein
VWRAGAGAAGRAGGLTERSTGRSPDDGGFMRRRIRLHCRGGYGQGTWVKKESSSFLKKSTKKLLHIGLGRSGWARRLDPIALAP